MSISSFALAYQKSPIVLTGGIAANLPGGMLPLISISQSADFDRGVLEGATALRLEDFMFNFEPAAGGTIIENQVATYPFANQTVAANAIIAQPLRISLLMVAAPNGEGYYAKRLSTFQTMQASLSRHNASGGTYTVATPSFLYQSLILLAVRDISSGDPSKPQEAWQWDFMQPLLTIAAAQAAQNSLMQKVSAGAKVEPADNGEISYSGQGPAVGNPASGQGPSTIPAAQSLPAASIGAELDYANLPISSGTYADGSVQR